MSIMHAAAISVHVQCPMLYYACLVSS